MDLYLQGLSLTHSQRLAETGEAEENGWSLKGQQAAAGQVRNNCLTVQQISVAVVKGLEAVFEAQT